MIDSSSGRYIDGYGALYDTFLSDDFLVAINCNRELHTGCRGYEKRKEIRKRYLNACKRGLENIDYHNELLDESSKSFTQQNFDKVKVKEL